MTNNKGKKMIYGMKYKYGYDKKHNKHFVCVNVTRGLVVIEDFFVANSKEKLVKKLTSWNNKYDLCLNINQMEF